jgi:hypothetical protein
MNLSRRCLQETEQNSKLITTESHCFNSQAQSPTSRFHSLPYPSLECKISAIASNDASVSSAISTAPSPSPVRIPLTGAARGPGEV